MKMKNFFKHVIVSKQQFIQSAVVLLIMGITSTAAIGFYRYKTQENMRLNTFAQLQILKSAIVQPLWNMDTKAIKHIVESVLADESNSILSIRVFDTELHDQENSILVSQNGPEWTNQTFVELKNQDDHLFLESPVSYKGAQLGTIQIIFNISDIQQEMARISLLLAIGLLFVTGLTASLFVTLHLRRLSKELKKQVEERTHQLDSQRMAMVNSSRLAALGEMSAGIAHEINNPLAVIEGTTQLISRAVDQQENPKKIEAHLEKISKMVTRISKIINGLRAFSRDASQEPKTEFLVERFFSDISDLCHSKLTNKQIEIQFVVDDKSTTLHAREVQLSQVIINMINNSVDAIDSLDHKWIRVECFSNVNSTVLSITDSGFGIPIEVQKKMLQPFFTTKEQGKGTGLGLSISIGIIEAHQGKLEYCQGQKHTRFEICLKKHSPTVQKSAA